MNNLIKKLVALVMAFVLMFTYFPANKINAATYEPDYIANEEDVVNIENYLTNTVPAEVKQNIARQ